MTFTKRQNAGALVILLAALTAPSLFAQTDNGVSTIAEYFDLLASGNIESAGYLWTEAARERSGRFGIEYEGIVLKTDCGSPVVRDLDLMKYRLTPPVKSFTEIDSLHRLMRFETLVDGKVIGHDYYLWFDGSYHWLTYPQDIYGRDWPVVESKYLRVHADPGVREYLNPVVLEETDRFIERTARRLGLSGDDIKRIEQKKLEYFYCSSDSLVRTITGALAKGRYDMASGDVISAAFPHYHEIAHFLTHYRLRRLPLFAQPLFHEGLAVHLGGRWGKAPTSLIGLGCFLYCEKLVELDSMLTMRLFERAAGADIAYPVSGLFIGFLIERLGLDSFFELYRKMTGDFRTVYGMTADSVQAKIARALDAADWAEVLHRFDRYVAEVARERDPIRPGLPASPDEIAAGEDYRIFRQSDWYGFEFSGTPQDTLTGNLLLAPDERLASARSSLFDEHYGGRIAFEGYRWGVRFDQNEIGLYDYGSNQLVAKYIFGLAPSDDYLDPDARTIRVRISRDLLDEKPNKVERKLLPY